MEYDSYVMLPEVFADYLREARQASADMTAAEIDLSNGIDELLGAVKEDEPRQVLAALWDAQMGPYAHGSLKRAGHALGSADKVRANILQADAEAVAYTELAAGEVDLVAEKKVRDFQDLAAEGARDANDFVSDWLTLPEGEEKS